MTRQPDGHAAPASMFLEFLLSRAGNAVLSMGTLVLVARATSVSTAGSFVAATGYALLLFSFLDLGTGPGLVRQAARGERERHITIYVWTRALLTVLAVIVGALGVLLLFPVHARTPGLLSLGWVAASMYGVLGPIGQVVGDVRPFRILSLLQGVVVLASIALVVALDDAPSPDLLVASYSLGAVLCSLLAVRWVRPLMVALPLAELRREIPANLRSIALLGFATSAGSIYLRIDQTLVLRYLGSAQSAFYGLAARIVTQARLVPSTLQFAIGNLLAQRHQRGAGLSPAEVARLTEVSAFGGVGLALCVAAVCDLGVWVLAGPDYRAAVIPAVIMSVGMVSTCFNYVVGTSAVMAGKDGTYLASTLAAACFNILANVLIVPSQGIEAAAIIATATELVALLIVRRALTPAQGRLSLVWLAGSVGVAAVGAEAKIAVLAQGLALNVVVSAVLLAVGGACCLRAFRALRALPHGREDHAVDAEVAAGIETSPA